MKSDDRRSRRVALVADAIMNPVAGEADRLATIADRDWGVIALPPERLGQPGIRQWIAGVADQVREFRRHGMTVVAVLDPGDKTVAKELESALAAAPRQDVPIHTAPKGEDELAAFLDRHGTVG
jgi:hypothetical protein